MDSLSRDLADEWRKAGIDYLHRKSRGGGGGGGVKEQAEEKEEEEEEEEI